MEDGNSRPKDNSEVPLQMLESPIGKLSNPTDFVSSMVSIGGNCDVYTPLKIKISKAEYSSNYACKVFVEITDREIDMDFEDSVKTAVKAFEKICIAVAPRYALMNLIWMMGAQRMTWCLMKISKKMHTGCLVKLSIRLHF